MRQLLLLLFSALFFPFCSFGEGGGKNEMCQEFKIVDSLSYVAISGQTRRLGFSCTSHSIQSESDLCLKYAEEGSWMTDSELLIYLPLTEFACEKEQGHKNFIKVMQDVTDPAIRFEMLGYKIINTPSGFRARRDEYSEIKILGLLTMAGRQNEVIVDLKGRWTAKGEARLKGKAELKMKDYGIEPSTLFWGLVRPKEEIDIEFDIIALQLD